ncbi:MAG TPA: hypothetical protein VJ725_29650 [Thermoanaerobaculia bacterium]|nr:hypothetical protein [Thermoanaerobaculia bacterium]
MNRLVVLFLAFLLLPTAVRASSEDSVPPVAFPTIPAQAPAKAGFVPKRWVVEKEGRGDLNGDGVPDLMLLLHMTDPKNVMENDGLGPDQLDTNPRMLVVAFADKAASKYSLALSNHTLIPRHTIPVMDDPLEGVAIVKGTLQVSLTSFMSAGSWYTSQTKFTFRYQDGCFKLIGYDSMEAKRNTGEMSTVSINYLTRKMKTAKGNLGTDKEEVSWKTIRTPKLLCLDAVGDGLEFSPES